ncbi:MAG TPA: peptide ABC transporter substrate-binding protein [Thermoflexales bacterium]|nr:peptide ABC transporter substrate-binding protein [Thermoflexales bacterium]
MAKKFLTTATLFVAASMALAACGGAPAAPTAAPAAATKAPAAAATAAPAAGGRGRSGTLRILYWQAPTILNFHLGSGTKDSDAGRLILEPLAALGPDGKPVARLAAEIPTMDNGGIAKDFSSVTWKLKKDVKWSDGTPFNADDVVFTYQYCADKATACTTANSFAGIKSVDKVDDYTVKITWEKPNTNSYQTFVSTQGYILQKKQFGGCIGAKANTDDACKAANNAPIGTGPFKLKEFKAGDTVTYDANPNYREADKPAFSSVIFKGGGDATSAARAVFQTGDTDYGWNLQVEAAVLKQLIDSGGKGNLLTIYASSAERLIMNFSDPAQNSEPGTKNPYLTDLKVRKALAMVIDKKVMAEQLYGPAGVPTCEIITTLPYIDPKDIFGGRNKCATPDIAGANKLLDEAGWKAACGDPAKCVREKDGKKLHLTYKTTTNALRQKEQALVKDAWAQIGVETELKDVSSTIFFSTDASNPDTTGRFTSDIQMYTNNYTTPDPTSYLCDFGGTPSGKDNGYRAANNGRYVNPDYDKLCADLRATTDPAVAKDLVMKMNDVLVNSDVVIVPLIARASVTSGAAKDLKGVVLSPWDSEMWDIANWYK